VPTLHPILVCRRVRAAFLEDELAGARPTPRVDDAESAAHASDVGRRASLAISRDVRPGATSTQDDG
jgi:hypothetical protein